ncbi:hypothetical protein LBMAG49_06040 [Planctomycetota bacterium]|nr:hypothetical protein LBMAG49_06040 [Planctomycetota bacterium]
MSRADIPGKSLRRLVEQILANQGKLSLELLLEVLVPVRSLRSIARKHGLTPKGGFRLAKAPAHVLAPLLAELREPEALDEVVQALSASAIGEQGPLDLDEEVAGKKHGSGPKPSEPEITPAMRRKDEEAIQLRGDLESTREVVARATERERDLRQQMDAMQMQVQQLKGELDRARKPVPAPVPAEDSVRELSQRVYELEQASTARDESDQASRLREAHDHNVMREQEAEISRIKSLIPKGQRRKMLAEPAPEPEHRVQLPHFLPSFYKSMEGKDRKSVERALIALLKFCTEGYAYPGLEVKQLHAQEMWSMRASLGLRIYFRRREDLDIDVIELVDREGQNTALRRLKER